MLRFLFLLFVCLKASDTVYKDTTLFQPPASSSPNCNTSSIKQAVLQFLHTALAYGGHRWEGRIQTTHHPGDAGSNPGLKKITFIWQLNSKVTLKVGLKVKSSVGFNTPNFTSKAKLLFSSLLLYKSCHEGGSTAHLLKGQLRSYSSHML